MAITTRTAHAYNYQEDVTSANLNKYAQGRLASNRVGVGQTSITAEAILTDYTMSVDVQGSNRALELLASVHLTAANDAADNFAFVRIRSGGLGGTVIGYASGVVRSSTIAQTITVAGIDLFCNSTITYYVTVQAAPFVTVASVASGSIIGTFVVSDIGPTT